MRKLVLIGLMLILTACQKPVEVAHVEPLTEDMTESFLRNHLMNEQGWLQTNGTTRKNEYLSESLGLWMLLLIEYDDQATFHTIVNSLPQWTAPNQLIYWQKENDDNATANAWIDDFRIAYALHLAAEKWSNPQSEKKSAKLSKQLVRYHHIGATLVDFYDLKSKQTSAVQTMSYYNEWAMEEILPKELVTEFKERRLLEETDGSIFPPTRYLVEEGYEFDEEINLIDVAYTLLYRDSWGAVEKASYNYLISTYEETGRLVGRVNRYTEQPIVTYEAPAVYALVGLVALQQDDEKVAQQMLFELQQQRVQEGPNAGAFMDVATGELHVFDHLLYLLLERKVSHVPME